MICSTCDKKLKPTIRDGEEVYRQCDTCYNFVCNSCSKDIGKEVKCNECIEDEGGDI
jgi:hypothetical protein